MHERVTILTNLGTPAAPTEEGVRTFLAEFLADPEVVDLPRWFWIPLLRLVILKRRPARVAEMYRSVWLPEGSPLDVGTRRMAAALRQRPGIGDGHRIEVAYRYGEPSVRTVMRRAADEGTREIVVVPLFPQRTDATTGTLARHAEREADACGVLDRLRVALPAPDAPGYIAALADRTREALAAATAPVDHLLVSFHGIPVRFARREQGVYQADCERTTAALAEALDWPADRLTLAYQSRFGFEKWLEPATSDVLEQFPGRGIKRVAVITPGFLTDGLETLEEIGIRGRESFEHAGGEHLVRVAAPEDHPAMIETLAAL